eukprot:6046263-Alexandrium_andersonii.AAC.1
MLPVLAQVLLHLGSFDNGRACARLGEYTCADGILDGLHPRDRDSDDCFIPFFRFIIRTEDTETGPNGLIVHAEHIGQ